MKWQIPDTVRIPGFDFSNEKLTGAAWKEKTYHPEEPDAFQRFLLRPGAVDGKLTFENKAALVIIGLLVVVVYGARYMGAM